MNFFRLRIINTILVLLIGIALGYMFKERGTAKSSRQYTPKYPTSGYGASRPATTQTIEPSPSFDTGVHTEISGHPAAKSGRKPASADEDYELPVQPDTAEDEPSTTGADAGKDDSTEIAAEGREIEDMFFKRPEQYAGRTFEMELQMILARKTENGWLLNFVHSRNGKNAEYIYIEDLSVLKGKPDLKIGYYYLVSFRCQKGDLNSGNRLLKIAPTGNKAAWASGISAVE